jgi:mycoredoxin
MTQPGIDPVTIYTKPGCPHCAAAKEDLRRRGVPYAERNVLADPDGLQEMLALNGGRRSVPTLVEGRRVTVGFDGA